MFKKDFKLKELDLVEIKENEFPLSVREISNTFRHRVDLIKRIKNAVNEISLSEPNLIVLRKIKNQPVKVFIDKERFIQEMLKRGFKLKEQK